MRTKINRPVAQHKTSPQQEWYDLGYADALEDSLDKDSDAYDTGYDNGLTDGREYSSSVEDRLSKVENRLTKLDGQI